MLNAPLYAIVFVAGVWQVQQSATLVSKQSLWQLAVCVMALFLAWLCMRIYLTAHSKPNASPIFGVRLNQHTPKNPAQFPLWLTLTKWCQLPTLITCLFLAGFVWATGFAQLRMQHALPKSLEQIPIQIEVVVASQPQRTAYGWRTKFDVTNVIAPQQALIAYQHGQFPQQVSLNYSHNQSSFNRTGYSSSTALNQQSDSTQSVSQLKVGERWRFTASLKKPHSTINPHGFDFEAWAISENLGATGTIKAKHGLQKLSDFVWRPSYMVEYVRGQIQAYLTKVLAEQAHRGLLQALVMGDQSQITVDDWQVMLKTGTTHLMSISGLHISMLAGLAFALTHFCWRRVPYLTLRLPARKAATIFAVITALLYALIAGFAVPTQRTLYMLCVFAIALWSGRQFAISQVLAVALVVVVLIDPWAVVARGFWLSFGAVACLALVFAGRVGKRHWFASFMTSQWAITLGLLPVLLMLFNQASLVSPIANAVAIPLVSIIVAPLALAGGFLHLDFLLQLSHFFILGGMQFLHMLSVQPMAVWQQHAPPVWTVLPALFGALWLLLPKGFPLKWLGLFGLLPMLLILPLRPDFGAMKVSILDVSQGLAVVVQTKHHTLLYDTGNAYSTHSDAGKNIIVPFLRAEGVRRLNGVMLSHQDTDHTGGLKSILDMMPVDWLSGSFDMRDYVQQLTPKPALFDCVAGQVWTWDAVHFEVLYPVRPTQANNDMKRSSNDQSCVLKISSGFGSILLTGDIEKQAETALLNNSQLRAKLGSDVMVVPHHGSKTSSRSDFIQAVSPSAAIFTVGYLNRYRHPRPDIVARYLNQDIAVYRSDYHGGVTLNFDDDDSVRLALARVQQKRYWHQSFN